MSGELILGPRTMIVTPCNFSTWCCVASSWRIVRCSRYLDNLQRACFRCCAQSCTEHKSVLLATMVAAIFPERDPKRMRDSSYIRPSAESVASFRYFFGINRCKLLRSHCTSLQQLQRNVFNVASKVAEEIAM